eukprot:11830482-Karenia_brevis.AAC.1
MSYDLLVPATGGRYEWEVSRYYSEEEKNEDDAEKKKPTSSTIPNFPEYDSSQRLDKSGAGAAK